MKKGIKYLLVLLTILSSVNGGGLDKLFDRHLFPTILNVMNNISRAFGSLTHQAKWRLTDEAAPEYDFIIVGGGSAGCVIANRLSEISKWKILLLEAGEPEDDLVDIPMLAPIIQNTNYDWKFKTVRLSNMSNCLKDGIMNYPRGKGLGGCSLLNLMMYVRGNKRDYDIWQLLGNLGWSYKDVLPYFLKSEGARLDHVDWRYHNRSGYLSVERGYRSVLADILVKAGVELGYPYFDYNAPNRSFGVSPMQCTLHNGRRESAARGFLLPIVNRTNLDIMVKSFVRKIIIDKGTNQAKGVIFEKDGRNHTVMASKEVILSAGAINSPQILMLSGIGPKSQLEKFGIEVIKELAVGENLLDHLMFLGVVYKVKFDADQIPLKLMLSLPAFICEGKGPLSAIGAVYGVGYINTNVTKSNREQPDIELIFAGGSLASGFGSFVYSDFRMLEECYNSIYAPLEGQHQFTIAPVLMQPKSVGYVELNSSDPHQPMKIDPRYYTDKKNIDIKTMIAGIRFIQRLGKTAAMKEQGAKLNELPLHGCTSMPFDSDDYWECALRSISNTIYHPMGTVKMGPKNDSKAVVNNHLQVYGVKKLRVADCSIIPKSISGHPNAAAIMIGEKVSDLIKIFHGV